MVIKFQTFVSQEKKGVYHTYTSRHILILSQEIESGKMSQRSASGKAITYYYWGNESRTMWGNKALASIDRKNQLIFFIILRRSIFSSLAIAV